MSELYYKIYKSERNDWKLTVVCMQYFDEMDYCQDRFLKDEDGYHFQFDTEEEAVRWLNDNIKSDMIVEEYRNFIPNDLDYFK